MGVSKLLLLSAVLLVILVLSEFTTQASAGSHQRQKHRQHRHHSKHREHPPARPRAPPPPPPALPLVPPAAGAPCDIAFGPWPPTVPAGSVSFNDGAHANFSQLTFISTGYETEGINGLLVEYVDAGGSFFQAQHGAASGPLNGTIKFDLSVISNNVFTQLGGSYTAAGLDSITLLDSGNDLILVGNNPLPGEPIVLGPTQTAFQSPPGVGYIVGLFGAANATALTQIGVCVTGA